MAEPDQLSDLGLPPDRLQAAREAGYRDQEIRDFVQRQRMMKAGDFEPRGEQKPFDYMGEQNVNRTQGEEFWPRLMASFKSTPRERYNFWKQYRGDANTVLTPAGEILIRGGRGWRPIDEDQFTFRDLADFAGDVPEIAALMMRRPMVGSAMNPTFSSKLLDMGVKAGLGNVVKQIAGAVMPGESGRGLGARAGEVGQAGVGGMAAQLLAPYLNFGGLTGGAFKGMGLLGKEIAKRLQAMHQSDTFKEGLAVQEKTGFPLDLAELSQDPALKVAKGFAERSAFGQSKAQLQEKAKDSAALAYLQRLMTQLGGEQGFGNQPLGEAASQAAGRSLADVQRGLASASDQYFGFLKNAIGERQIPVNNYREALLRQAQYYRSMQTSTGRELADELEAAANDMNLERPMNEVSSRPASLNARAIQEHLQNLGEASFGKEGPKFFRNMRSYGKTRDLKELHQALREDLISAEQAGGRARPPALALRQAREQWESEMDVLRQLQDLPLLKFMESKGMLQKAANGEPLVGFEHVEKNLLEGMRSGKISPSEISNMVKMLSAVNSDFPNQLAGGLLNSAIQAGKAAGRNRPAGFSYEEAGKALPSPEHLQSIYKDVWQPGQQTTGLRVGQDVTDLLKAIERSGASGQGIPGAPHTTLINIANQLLTMKEGPVKSALKSALSQIIAPRKIQEFLYDPKRARAIMEELNGQPDPFASGYLPRWARDQLAPLIYESTSALKPTNQPGYGEQ